MRQAVAISTTGDEHRIGFLETAVQAWDAALSPGDSLFVTVDGDNEACARVMAAVEQWTGSIYQVGLPVNYYAIPDRLGDPAPRRIGVAANKNTGLELMMDSTRAEHLFLCDDDTYPLGKTALFKHVALFEAGIPHSMVCWGAHRLHSARRSYAAWTWPRGVMLYTHRNVVDQVGGMIERFGAGGHEHAEWSRRIHQRGFTPAPYCTPVVYAARSVVGKASRASVSWHCEDMRQPEETSVELGHRRKKITTLHGPKDWENANGIMEYMDGRTPYVPFRAHQNRRGSATLWSPPTSRGAGGDL